jgi:uncharacterized membrane protein YphA (DoxX/SURF4 family)
MLLWVTLGSTSPGVSRKSRIRASTVGPDGESPKCFVSGTLYCKSMICASWSWKRSWFFPGTTTFSVPLPGPVQHSDHIGDALSLSFSVNSPVGYWPALWHVAMVRISGGFEILGGLGLLVPQMRRAAACGLIALLIAVFPANATNPIDAGAASIASVLTWGRLPLQLLLIWWLLWCTRPRLSFR